MPSRSTCTVYGSNPLTEVQSLQQLQEIVQSLYGAIDLAKPAHVGLEFTTVFAEAEQLTLNIVDTWRLIILEIENPPLNPMLYVAPIFNVKNPKTTLSSWGTYLPTPISSAHGLALQTCRRMVERLRPITEGACHLPLSTVGNSTGQKKGSTGQNPTTSPDLLDPGPVPPHGRGITSIPFPAPTSWA